MANISTSTLHEADEAHYDVPWEFIHRTKSSPNQNDRPHSECTESLSVNRIDASLLKSPKYCVRASDYSQRYSAREKPDKFSASPSLKNHKFHRVSSSSPIEKLSAQPSNVDNGRNGLKQNLDELRKRLNETGIVKRERYHEEELVHRGVDRLEAERRLLNCRLGSFLVRVRDNGNLALSIRANKGILHIKLEFTAAVATSTGNNPAPTNVIEYVYMTFSWMMGVFVFALLLGQIRDIVSNANRNREQYRQTMDMCLIECKRLQLPKEIIDRVRDWFIYTWHRQKTLDEKKLIEKLPLKLQTDLALSVHYNTLSKVQLFQDCDRALLRELVLKLRPVIFLPGDMICKKGDVGKEMYIVNDGILQVVGGEQNEKVFAELTEGSVFGEISLLAIGGNNRRTANIRSKGYATLFVLSKEDLNDVIKDYPEAQQLLRQKARQMLSNDAKVKQENEKGEQKTMEERCRISTHISTPRILDTVVKVLPEKSLTGRQLRSAIETRCPTRMQRIGTLPEGFSDDESDAEVAKIFENDKKFREQKSFS